MLEKLPDLVGQVLRGQRAGLDKTAFHAVDLRAGMAAIRVGSLAFADHAPIPERYTADGDGDSPPLHWSGVPEAAASVAVIVEDADSPTPQPLVHAIVVGLSAGDGGLAEAALPSRDHDGSGLRVGRNSYLQAAWLPPDPPPGHGVHQGLRRRRVGILDDQQQGGGGRRHAGPLQRRRDAFAVGGVAVGNRRVVGEGQAAHRDRGHAAA